VLIKLHLDEETSHRLEEDADAERRPPHLQAEVLIRRALGLAFPYPKETCRAVATSESGGGNHAVG
jgi:hypothetical protein